MKYIIIILTAISLSSCLDDRTEFLSDLNEAPSIEFINDRGEKTTLIEDSLKTSLKSGKEFYLLGFELSDRENKIKSLTYSVGMGKGVVFVDGFELEGNIIPIEEESIIEYRPSDEGLHIVEFVVTDDLDKSSKVTLNLEVFDNLAPVAVLPSDITKIGLEAANHYEINASGSYDRDVNQGGGVATYEWDINGIIAYTNTPYYEQTFQKGGYEVKLTVYDNDGRGSDTVTKIYQIQ